MKPYLFLLMLFLTAQSSFAQILGRKYSQGTYYTIDGQKREGLIAYDFSPPSIFSSSPDNKLFFKADSNAKREKIKASTMKSFIVTNKDTARVDSFVIVKKLERSRIKYDFDFIQVIFDRGPIKLYNYRLQRQTGAGINGFGLAVIYYDNYYFFGENADDAVEMKRKNFKDVMSKMLADDPEIVNLIQNEKYSIGDMHEMLKAYYSHRLTAAK